MIKRAPNNKKISPSKMATRKKGASVKEKQSQKLDRAKLLIIVTGLLIATAAAIYAIVPHQQFDQSSKKFMPIRLVEIEGSLIHVTRELIIAKLKKVDNSGNDEQSDTEDSSQLDGFFSTDLQLLEQELQTIAWLQKVELRRVWPDRLRIKVKEHRAIARWNKDELINQLGEIFKPESIDGLEQLPLLTGPEEELQLLLLTFRELQQLLAPIELQLDVLNLSHRYSWSLELANGIQLQVGRKHLIQRVERFVALYPLLKSESKLAIEKVDLRYDTGLAVTRLATTELQASL